MARKHLERCSASFSIRKMQNKITVIHDFPPIRMVKILKRLGVPSTNEEAQEAAYTAYRNVKPRTATLENNLAFPPKTKNILTI